MASRGSEPPLGYNRSAMPKQPAWETIVSFGCEGGAVRVLGHRRPDGTWELRCTSNSMILDANDDEDWVEDTRSLGALAEAFEGSRSFFGAMVPIDPVHPDFRSEMRAIIQAITPQPGDVGYKSWERHNRERWHRACEPPETDQ